jgi:hypothetical protein
LIRLIAALSLLTCTFVTAKEFIVGVEAIRYYPLFDFQNNDISQPSFTKDLLTDFFETHQYEYRLVPLPIKRFDKWYLEQGIDFKFPDNIRWRENNRLNITFSDPVLELMAGTYVLKKNAKLTRENVNALGTILGFFPTLWLDRLKAGQTTLHEESTPLGVVKHLLHGNVEATNIDENVIRHNLALLGKPGEIVLNTQIHHEKYNYHFSTINYPEVIEKFNLYLQDNEDKINQLKVKYNISP